jgi:hypothetical protein
VFQQKFILFNEYEVLGGLICFLTVTLLLIRVFWFTGADEKYPGVEAVAGYCG